MSNNEAVRDGVRWSELIAPLVLVGLAFAWVYGVGGASTRIMQSYHGLHHAAYVTQIANGFVPPENPSSIGAPANFYWAWHAALAFGARAMNVTPFEMSLSSNALGLAMTLCGFWLCAGAFTRDPLLRFAACALPWFVLNPLGTLQFSLHALIVGVPAWFDLAAGEGAAEWLAAMAAKLQLGSGDPSVAALRPSLGGGFDVVLLDRAGHLLNKFLNFNSFPIALGLYVLATDVLLALRGGPLLRAFVLAILCAGMALTSPLVVVGFAFTVLAVIGVDGPIEWRALVKTGWQGRRAGLIAFVAPLLGCALGVAVALPLLLPIQQAYGGETVLLLGAPGFWRHAIALGWALLPGFGLLALAAAVARDLDPASKVHALALAGMSSAALVVAAPLQDPNEYKLVLLSAIPASLLLLGLLGTWARRSRSLDLALRSPLYFSVAFLAGAAAVGGSLALIYLASPWASQNPLRLHGADTDWVGDGEPRERQRGEALAWIRENTPPEAHVFARARKKDEDPIPSVAARRVVAQLASPFTLAVPAHMRLLDAQEALVESVARCEASAIVDDHLATLDAMQLPFETAPYLLVEPGVGVGACRPSEGLRPVFRNRRFAIYDVPRLAPEARGPTPSAQ